MGRYKVITYPWNLGSVGSFFGGPDPNTPYVKTNTDNHSEAVSSWQEARSGNYTCVLWDSSVRSALQVFHSGMDGGGQARILAALTAAGVVGASVVGGVLTLPAGGGAAAAAAFSAGGPVYTAAMSQFGAGDAMTKALTFCLRV
jgi:hypothetical protein